MPAPVRRSPGPANTIAATALVVATAATAALAALGDWSTWPGFLVGLGLAATVSAIGIVAALRGGPRWLVAAPLAHMLVFGLAMLGLRGASFGDPMIGMDQQHALLVASDGPVVEVAVTWMLAGAVGLLALAADATRGRRTHHALHDAH